MSGFRQKVNAVVLVIAVAFLPQCVRGDETSRAFSPEWVDEVTRPQPQKLDPKGIPLTGGDNPNGPRIKMDEKGKPRLTIGKDIGVSADLDIDEEPGIKLKFKRKWDAPVRND
jgi:hypothetical protein